MCVCVCVCVSLIMCKSYKAMVSIELVALRQNKVHPQQAHLCHRTVMAWVAR